MPELICGAVALKEAASTRPHSGTEYEIISLIGAMLEF
jgi:hypothetical protein